MALIKRHFCEVEVHRWKVKADASDLFGGMFQLRMASANSDHQFKEWLGGELGENKVVFFPKSSLEHLNFVGTAGDLLCAALRQYPLLRFCNNLDLLAALVAAYLCCKYRFSPEILFGQGPYKPMIRIDLLVILQEHDSPRRVVDREDLDKLDKLIILERDAKLVRGTLRKCYSGGEEWAADMEEVEGGLAMRHLVNDDGNGSEETKCPVCLERFKYLYAAQASCSHEFHQECITSWLLRADSCPMCRSALPVWV